MTQAARQRARQITSSGAPTNSIRSSRSSTSSTEARRARSSWWASRGSARRGCSRSSRLAPSCAGTSSSRDRRRSSSATCRSRSSCDALDEYVESLDAERLSTLDDDVQAELAHVFPSLSALAGGRERGAPARALSQPPRGARAARASRADEAARTRARRLPLGRLRRRSSCSAHCCAGRRRRRCSSALALRPRQTPERLAAALERAHRAAALTRIELGALTPDRGSRASRRDASTPPTQPSSTRRAAATRSTSSSSPGRSSAQVRATPAPEISLTGIEVPPAVAASLSEELALLSDGGRLVLEGAAVAGDPFEPELAAAAAATSEAAAMDAVDELLQLDLVRATDVPRRFRFRHPLVRRAVYEATAGGWRLGAHERCAEALAARGATAAARAHHVERSARQGDVAAVAVLREAGEAAARLAPESAARWFGAALRLLPQTAPAQERVELLLARAGALAAAGHFTDSHEALLEAIAIVPEQSSALCTTVATACAGVERQLGRYEQAHARLVRALRGLPEPASVESVELLIELTLNEFYRSRYEAMHDWAGRAVSAAKELGDAALHGGGARDARARGRHDRTDRNSSIPPCRSRSARRRAVRRRALAPPRRGGLARCGRALPRPLRRGRRAREPCPRARSRDGARGSLVPPVPDPAQDLVRARQAGRGRRAPGRRHRGRAPARVPAGSRREPLQPLRRRARRRRSRHRARHRRGGRRAHARPRRRLRHGLGCGEARRRPARNRATGPSRRAAPRPRRR